MNFILSKNPIITIHKKPDELTKVKNIFKEKELEFFNLLKNQKKEERKSLKIFKNEKLFKKQTTKDLR